MRYRSASSPNHMASLTGISLRIGKGKNTITPTIFRSRCANAITNAAFELANEAKKAVMVVPILAPSIKGNIFLTEISPVAATGMERSPQL